MHTIQNTNFGDRRTYRLHKHKYPFLPKYRPTISTNIHTRVDSKQESEPIAVDTSVAQGTVIVHILFL